MTPAAVRRVGERALLAELDDDAQVTALYGWLCERQARQALGAVEEIVPAARTVLLDGVADVDAVAALLRTARPPAPRRPTGRWWRCRRSTTAPTSPRSPRCGGVRGGDRADPHRARVRGRLLRVRARLRLPHGAAARVRGPAPGHAAQQRPGRLRRPGRPLHRRLPALLPGGWQLLGRTGLALWDTGRDPAALLAPGVRVRFTAERA